MAAALVSHPKLHAFDAVIVDLDGTLVDTLGDFVAALNGMLEELALPLVDRSVVELLVGKGSEHLIRTVLQHVQVLPDAGLYDRAWAHYQDHYRRINGRHAVLYSGVAEGLTGLAARGLRLACLTNKPAAFARALLESKGLAHHFAVIFGGDDFVAKKPDPLPVLETCKALGTVPGRTLMIGDSSNDAQAARAAGCPVVLVTYGYNHGAPVHQVDADGFVDAIEDLLME